MRLKAMNLCADVYTDKGDSRRVPVRFVQYCIAKLLRTDFAVGPGAKDVHSQHTSRHILDVAPPPRYPSLKPLTYCYATPLSLTAITVET